MLRVYFLKQRSGFSAAILMDFDVWCIWMCGRWVFGPKVSNLAFSNETTRGIAHVMGQFIGMIAEVLLKKKVLHI